MKTIGLTFVDVEKTVDTAEKKPVEKKKKSTKKAESVDVILPEEDE